MWRAMPVPNPPAHAPYVRCREAPIWRSKWLQGSMASNLVLKGVAPDWKTVPPLPRYNKGRYDVKTQPLLYEARDKCLAKDVVMAAPRQDPAVLVDEYGCFISSSFVLEQEFKKPRWCFHLHDLGTYERKKSSRQDTLKQAPGWAVPGMFTFANDAEDAFFNAWTKQWSHRFFTTHYNLSLFVMRRIFRISSP